MAEVPLECLPLPLNIMLNSSRQRRVAALLFGLALPLCAQQNAAPYGPQTVDRDWNPAATAWWANVQYLADDKLQGRLPGTPGFAAAVAYVQDQFKTIGLKPGGTDSYLQQVAMRIIALDADQSSFALETNGTATPLSVGTEVQLSPRVVTSQPIKAKTVFIGYGLVLPSKHLDPLAGVDVRGKVVVLFNGAPENVLGPLRSYAPAAKRRWKALERAGAIGTIVLTPPRDENAGRRGGNGGAPRPTTVLADIETMPGMQLNATLAAKSAAQLFTGSGHTFEQLAALAHDGKPLPSFPLMSSVQAKTAVTELKRYTAPNVIGILPGSDPKLAKEYLVISAHLDHLGVGRPVNGDAIYNGAMDNASGVASVIETAKLLAAGPRLKRSILFIGLEGEELGELGSEYFASKPTVAKPEIVGDLNMDMYLPLFPLHYLEVQGLGESTLGNDIRAICQLNDVEPQFDKQPAQNRFIRSDQVNFVDQGIPAIAFKFGWVPDSPEETTFNNWVSERYHKPSDDLEQPVDKVGAAQFDNLLAQLAARVADAQARPTWYPESPFATVAR
jgi:hypothetical protein